MNTTPIRIVSDQVKIDHPLGTTTSQKERFYKYFAKLTQFLVGPIVYIFFHSFFTFKVNGKRNLNGISSPFIVISNHISFFDSFAFRLVFNKFNSHLPLRFMAVNKFSYHYLNLLSKIGVVNIIYKLFGVFLIKKGDGLSKNLRKAYQIINEGGNIVLYPEGKISTLTNNLEPFKIGAAILAKDTNATVIPVSMKMCNGKGTRKEFTINIGAKIEVDKTLSAKEITTVFFDTVFDLYKKIS